MWPYTIHDLVVRYDLCNLRCDYCGLAVEEVPRMVRRGDTIGLKDGKGIRNAERVGHVSDRIAEQIKGLRDQCEYPLLKISGGELSIIPEWVDLIFDLALDIPAIQLLTNGTGLSRSQVEALARLDDFVLQVSLDGHTQTANTFRGLTQRQVDRILDMIVFFLENGTDVEINVVLTRANIDQFPDFARWAAEAMSGGKGRLMLNPRPVRGPGAESTRANREDIRLRRALERAPTLVLPPKPFLDRMLAVLETGHRGWPCYVPYYVLGTHDRGGIDICTCGPHLGPAGSVGDDPSYTRHGSSFIPDSAEQLCVGCVTQYEVFNLYFENAIDDNDLETIPSLRIPRVLEGVKRTSEAIHRKTAASKGLSGSIPV